MSASVRTRSSPLAVCAPDSSRKPGPCPVSTSRSAPHSGCRWPAESTMPRKNNSPSRQIRPEPQTPAGSPPADHVVVARRRSAADLDALDRAFGGAHAALDPGPSNAGPAEQAQPTIQSALPMTISPLVPMSMKRKTSSRVRGKFGREQPGGDVAARRSCPRRARTRPRRPGWISSPTSPAVSGGTGFTVGTYGASRMWRGGSPSSRWIMVVLPAMNAARIVARHVRRHLARSAR